MNKSLSILIVNACYRASRELGEMGVMVGELAPDERGLEMKHLAGQAIADIGAITEAVFKLHPDLERYVEDQIQRFGRVS